MVYTKYGQHSELVFQGPEQSEPASHDPSLVLVCSGISYVLHVLCSFPQCAAMVGLS